MLREAVRVLSKNLNDPFLAFLVARIVESRQPLQNAYLIGPEARRILLEDILPSLNSRADHLFDRSDALDRCGIDATMLSITCGMLLQDKSIIRTALDSSTAAGIFRLPLNSPLSSVVHNQLSVAAALDWLVSSHYCNSLHRAGIVQSFLSLIPAEYLKARGDITLRLMHAKAKRKGYSSFHKACINSMKKWEDSNSIIKSKFVENDFDSKDIKDTETVIEVSKGFNFSRVTVKSASIDLKHHSPLVTAGSEQYSSQAPYDPLAAFDVLSERQKKGDSGSYDPLAAFDVPLAAPKKADPVQYDPLAAFEVPLQRQKKVDQEPYDPLAAFDIPSGLPKKPER